MPNSIFLTAQELKKKPSIRVRLIERLSSSLIIVTIITFCLILLFLHYKVNKYFDDALLHESTSVIKRLYVEKGQLKFKQPHRGINLQTSSGNSSVYYSVADEKGTILSGYENIPTPSHHETMQVSQRYYDATYSNQDIRVLYIKHQLFRQGAPHIAYITIAETFEDRYAMIQDLLLATIAIALIIGTVSVIASLIAVNQGLQPLINLQYSFQRRDIHDLTPIKEYKTPIEVISLVKSINQLFVKLKKSFSHIERFNADVSHQLRTPLAELKMLIEMDESIENTFQRERYLEIINNMTYTTQQLLLYAKTNPDSFDRVHFTPLNLTALCEKVAMDKVTKIYAKGFEFAFEADSEAWINGGSVILEGMISNLINNALNYAVDDKGNAQGTIILSLIETPAHVIMSVADEGPGIPNQYLDSIYDRFFRIDTKKQGSGLGLSIVKQIAELHEATVSIFNQSPHGLNVSIKFPKCEAPSIPEEGTHTA